MELKREYRAKSEIDLMNIFQDQGIISDNCISIEDIPDRDLIHAYGRHNQKEHQ